jgi:hypothetical protein
MRSDVRQELIDRLACIERELAASDLRMQKLIPLHELSRLVELVALLKGEHHLIQEKLNSKN